MYELDSLIRVHLVVGIPDAFFYRIGWIYGVISELALQFSRVNGLWPILIRRIQNGVFLRLCLYRYISITLNISCFSFASASSRERSWKYLVNTARSLSAFRSMSKGSFEWRVHSSDSERRTFRQTFIFKFRKNWLWFVLIDINTPFVLVTNRFRIFFSFFFFFFFEREREKERFIIYIILYWQLYIVYQQSEDFIT